MEKAIEFAKSIGFYNAKYIGRYKNYEIFEPVMKEHSFIGIPIYIVFDGLNYRKSTFNESFAILDYFN